LTGVVVVINKKKPLFIQGSERYIRAEVVTYRLDVAVGSLHTQQLHGFDESRNDQVIIQNFSAKINTVAALLYLLASYFIFRNSSTFSFSPETPPFFFFFNDSRRSELS
jgi:hypothetical protein